MNIVKASLKHRQVTLTILLLMFLTGVWSLITMPRREDPKITIPGGLVVAYFPGADANQVEDQVTRKLEEYLFQYEEVRKDKTYSISTDGMVEIHIWLQDNVRQPDIFWSKLKHQLNVVKAVVLPQGTIGPVVNSDFGDTESMIIALSSDEAGYREMKNYALLLEEKLRQISAVSKLKRTGEQKEQIRITFDSEKVAQFGIDLSQVVKIIQSENYIGPSGTLKTDNISASLYPAGYYRTEADISNQIAGISKSGALIRLEDIADIKRVPAEPSDMVTVNGHNAILLTLQMHEGKNFVRAGKEVEKYVREFMEQLPSGIELTTIVNQPEIVSQNITHFLREFLLAIISVILVVFLLLPFSIAAVAATAIPMTISVTIAILHVFGIELHQVSLASLIAVLGIVVDDAVVIADNYVELLDRGNDRWTAAWRSATDLVVPVMTATVTIIASFLPLVILTGAVGEFIRALPITVAIALSSSFIVAMVLTPLLCYMFIKKGIHSGDNNERKGRNRVLNLLQDSYDRSIEWCLRNKGITITGSLLTILLAGLLFRTGVRQKFFPEAERNQFIVELWMPTGTRLEKTAGSVAGIEKILKGDDRIVSYAVFTGRSAPRFYYNYSPEMPSSNFAQILINTKTKKMTGSLVGELKSKVDSLVPEGRPLVRLMQQGQPLHSHIEVRISGDDLSRLKRLASEVSDIIRNTPGSDHINTDFREDTYGISVHLREEAANMGFSTSAVSQQLFTGFNGYTVSTMFEGMDQVDIVLRLDEKNRKNSDDLENTYIQSPVTGASVPLRQIAYLSSEWRTGRIIHRNGIRTITVECEPKDDVLPSALLNRIKPELEKIKMPSGYKMYYGGEQANKQETFGYMSIALVISLIIIFIVLLFQFRNLKEVGLVMLTIPLSLFGAIFGLFITGNDFGFTAFTGLISLSGIVVRNAIILIDHTNELLEKGMDIPTAAYEAGKRRLRPIFLTAMAAAIGVLPMILSGSPLWSPLASVIAFGVVWSMVISTLTVPVLYSVAIKPADKRNIVSATNNKTE
jgi:multidrug efflux pump subunit AcrB